MVGIDNGNLSLGENVPFDPLQPGATLSRRFETKTWQARQYGIGIAVLDPVEQSDGPGRMFVVPRRGVDDSHTSCYIDSPQDGNAGCYPPILELDPVTGAAVAVLDGEPLFSTTRRPSGLAPPGSVASAVPIIAYDGMHLYVSVEFCPASGDPLCMFPRRSLWRIDPDSEPIGFSYMGELLGYPVGRLVTGMTEIDGTLYALVKRDPGNAESDDTFR